MLFLFFYYFPKAQITEERGIKLFMAELSQWYSTFFNILMKQFVSAKWLRVYETRLFSTLSLELTCIVSKQQSDSIKNTLYFPVPMCTDCKNEK